MSPAASTDGLRAANAAFYEAFERLDLARMTEVWATDASVRCVHPGGRMLAGWDAVRGSFAGIFGHAKLMQFILTQVDVWEEGALGWVTCQENVVQGTETGEHYGTVYATNIYRRDGDRWRMIVHHASPVAFGA